MKNQNKLIMALEIIIFIVFLTVAGVFAATPGTSDDPLVSKSYVDDKINQVLSSLNGSYNNSYGQGQVNSNVNTKEIADEVMKEVEPLIAVMMNNYSNGGASNTNQDNLKYTPVYAENGKIIVGGEGTEIILRSGKAKAYSEGVAGIVNITLGKELQNSAKIDLNNLILIPRNDGRGVQVTENAWFMIKGEYQIK